MKRIIAIGFAIALLIGAVLLWEHFQPSTMTGTWIADLGQGMHNTTTFCRDGSFVCQITGRPGGEVVTYVGSWRVKDGFLVNTPTQMKINGKVTYPKESIDAEIIHMNANTLVVRPIWNTNLVTFVKN